MGFLSNLFRGSSGYSKATIKSITRSADALNTEVTHSIRLAAAASDIETKKQKLDYAMKRLVELIKLANEYYFIDFRKISAIYESIRDVRNEIKNMEVAPLSGSGEVSAEEAPAVTAEMAETGPESTEPGSCPYCSYSFPVMPQRKTSCPSCGKLIYVWYSTVKNMKKLITEEEAQQIERDLAEQIQKYELLNKQKTLEKTEEEVRLVQEELKEKDPKASLDDAYLFLLNNKIKQSKESRDLAGLYYLKALLLDNSGKDPFGSLTEARKQELLHLKSHGFVKKVQIITNPDCCPVCKADSDKVLSIDEALAVMPLPHKDCSRKLQGGSGFCRCTYLIVNER